MQVEAERSLEDDLVFKTSLCNSKALILEFNCYDTKQFGEEKVTDLMT